MSDSLSKSLYLPFLKRILLQKRYCGDNPNNSHTGRISYITKHLTILLRKFRH